MSAVKFGDGSLNRQYHRVSSPRKLRSPKVPASLSSHLANNLGYLDDDDERPVKNYSRRVQTRSGEVTYSAMGEKVREKLRLLKDMQQGDEDAKDCDDEASRAAADIYARVVAERRLMISLGLPTDKVLKTTVHKILAELPEDRIVDKSPKVDLHERIGGGLNGEVYLGELNGVPVAAKKMRAKAQKNSVHEIKSLAMLDHPNVVRLLCLSEKKHKPLLVYEYMETSLWEAIHVRRLQVSDGVKMDLMAQLWKGLGYLHSENVAHANIKATNILLSDAKGRGPNRRGIVAKLGDFGFTSMRTSVSELMQKRESAKNNNKLQISGLIYAAPEVLRMEKLGMDGEKKADVYSMAVICYEISTEKEPFGGELAFDDETLKLRMDDHAAPSQFELDFGMHACLERCWVAQPGRRPAAKDMVVALETLKKKAVKIYSEF